MHLFQFLKMVMPQVLAGSGEDPKDAFEPASKSCVFQSTQASQASVLSLKVTHPRSVTQDLVGRRAEFRQVPSLH